MSKAAARRAINNSRRPSPADKAAKTMGRTPGRITQKQLNTLERLGVSKDVTLQWTLHRAKKEIARRLERLEKQRQKSAQLIRPQAEAAPALTNGVQVGQAPDTVASQKAVVPAVVCDHDRRLSS